jgi:hypothetical protein
MMLYGYKVKRDPFSPCSEKVSLITLDNSMRVVKHCITIIILISVGTVARPAALPGKTKPSQSLVSDDSDS